jgi:hypothetical protein
MNNFIIRKILVAAIIIAPLISYAGCKKQAKCGCEGDILFSLTKKQGTVYYNPTGTSITFTPIDNPYETYNFCNPSEMFATMGDYESGDVLLVSGNVFWECNFLYQSSNYSYGSSYYKVYMVQATEVTVDLYGKKK